MYLEKLKLDGRVAVITGAGQGIGAACAQALGEAGAIVIVADMLQERIDATVQMLRQKAVAAHGALLDVTQSKQVDDVAVQLAIERQDRGNSISWRPSRPDRISRNAFSDEVS